VIVQVEFGPMVPLVKEIAPAPATGVGVNVGEPHPELATFGGLARKTPLGRVSASTTWVRVLPSSLFVIRMDSRLVAPANIVPGLKLLLIEGVGDLVTFNVALAGVVFVMFMPLRPVEVSAPRGMVLIRLPAVVDVTLMDTVQDPAVFPVWAGTVPPLKANVVPPAVALTVPPQELVKPTGLAMVKPG